MLSCDIWGYTFLVLLATPVAPEKILWFCTLTINVHFKHGKITDLHLENLLAIPWIKHIQMDLTFPKRVGNTWNFKYSKLTHFARNKSTELNKSFSTHYSGICYTCDVSLKSANCPLLRNLCDCNMLLRTTQRSKQESERDRWVFVNATQRHKQCYLLDTVQTFAWPPPVFEVAFEGGRRWRWSLL